MICLPSLGQPLGPRRLSLKQTPKLPNMEAILYDAHLKVKKQAAGCLSPEICFQAVEASVYLPFAEGIRKEKELFLFLLTSGQAKALQYAFFAQRIAEKWMLPNGASWKTASPQPIRKAAVIGKTVSIFELFKVQLFLCWGKKIFSIENMKKTMQTLRSCFKVPSLHFSQCLIS